jgi:hypothetical protein
MQQAAFFERYIRDDFDNASTVTLKRRGRII